MHRDLKPDNVLLTHADDDRRLMVKLVDFGVSMILDDRPAGSSAAVDGTEPTLTGEAPTPEAVPSLQLPGSQTGEAAPTAAATPAAATAMEPTAAPPPSSRSGLSQTARDRLHPATPRPHNLTQTGVIMGTPLYMAPELRLGARLARPASDMFSFGVLGFELLTGQLPTETPAMFLTFRGNQPWFPRVRSKHPDVPGPLGDLIERCLDPEPERRPTAHEAAEILRSLRSTAPGGLG